MVDGERGIAALAVLLAGLALYFFHRLAARPLGKAMVAVRDSETAARAIGYNPVIVKTIAFALSAAFTGLAGGLFASLMTFVAPSSFPFSQSILFLLVRDRGRRRLHAWPCARRDRHRRAARADPSLAEYRLLMFGALLLVVLWLAPEGVLGTLARHWRGRGVRPAQASDFDIAAFLGAGGPAPLVVSGLTIAFGGVRAATDVCAHRRARPRDRADRSQRRRQDDRAQHDRRLLSSPTPAASASAAANLPAHRRGVWRAPASRAPTRQRSCSARSACSTTC